jgi:hypothetical protein
MQARREGVVTKSARDGRVDLLRGFALLTIFVDHIPNNGLASITLHNFGFSDAAELFVLLAGFSTATAYGRLIDRDGIAAGALKVGRRCLVIYGVHALLFLTTLALVAVWSQWSGVQSKIVGPLLHDGAWGAFRGLTLWALPTYLDILPLYIVLLAAFPLIWMGARYSLKATLVVSVIVYATANVFHLDLPNAVDPSEPSTWYFNPFTWQLIFCLGIAGAIWTRERKVEIPVAVRLACATYLLFAFFAVDAWNLWPAPFGQNFAGTSFPFAFFGNEPKSYVTPWRLFHVFAIALLVLASSKMTTLSTSKVARPLVSCGRHSLLVFAAGCFLALVGRLFLNTVGVGILGETVVNGLGLALLLVLGVMLEDARLKTARRTGETLRRGDVERAKAQPKIDAHDLSWGNAYVPVGALKRDVTPLLAEIQRTLQAASDLPDDTTRLTDDVRYAERS